MSGLRIEAQGRITFMSKLHTNGKRQDLGLYSSSGFERGASKLKQICWFLVSNTLIDTWLPGSGWRRIVLRAFGATIGTGVVLKPRIRVKFPWRLHVGAHSWIGESVWIDNLDTVRIGHNTCVSQGTYFCTGSHDWSHLRFSLITKPIEIGDGCWIAAFCKISPGCVMEDGAVLSINGIGKGRLRENTIYLTANQQRARTLRH